MPSSPIRKLVPYADAAKSKGIKVFHLNIGQPDIKTPEVALQAVRDANLSIIEYSHSAGMPEYRRKLSKYYSDAGISVSVDEILVTIGGSEAVRFAFMSCLDLLDEVIVPEPFYANYEAFATEAGAVIKPVTSTIENGFKLPSIADFEKIITPRTKAVLICNPNNPTGYLYSEEELKQLRDIVLRHNLFLISDEVYREFCYDGAKHFSVMNLEGLDDNVIMIDSVSKRYSECGLRIGALITRNREVIDASMKLAQSRLSPPTYGQIVAMASLEVDDSYFSTVNEEYRLRRNFLVEGLNRIPGVYSPMPRGAFYTVASLPVDDAERFCVWMLSEFSYKNSTVMLAPATGFYASKGIGRNEVRIAYVLNREELALSLEILEKALEVYPGRTKVDKK
jgi:aspartate aminotransferase